MKSAIANYNADVEQIRDTIRLESKSLAIQREEFRKFGFTIETNNRRLSELES